MPYVKCQNCGHGLAPGRVPHFGRTAQGLVGETVNCPQCSGSGRVWFPDASPSRSTSDELGVGGVILWSVVYVGIGLVVMALLRGAGGH